MSNVVKINCPENYTVTYTFTMATADWSKLAYTHYLDDGNGGRSTDTAKLLTNCKSLDGGLYTSCDIKFGKYDNYKELGLSKAHQTTAGWINAVNSNGLVGASIRLNKKG